jgi:hypothetical protein
MTRRPAALLALAALAAFPGCSRRDEPRLSALEANLERRILGLQAMIAEADGNSGRIVRFDHILVVVRQRLVQSVLDAGLPFERVVGGRFGVTVAKAEVLLEDGFATVRLDGQARLMDRQDVRADISVYGALDIVDLDPQSGVLRGRVRVYAVEARKVEVAGFGAPVEKLVEDLGRERLEAFEALLSSLEIPVRVAHEITLPGVAAAGVKIEATAVPVQAVVESVKSFRQRLWITIRTAANADAAPGPSPTPSPPPGGRAGT